MRASTLLVFIHLVRLQQHSQRDWPTKAENTFTNVGLSDYLDPQRVTSPDP